MATLAYVEELQKSLNRECIKGAMRRRKLDGLPIGRQPRTDIDHDVIVADRLGGMSLSATAKRHGVSRTSVIRFVREARQRGLIQHLEECAV